MKLNKLITMFFSVIFTAVNINLLTIPAYADSLKDDTEHYAQGGLWSEMESDEDGCGIPSRDTIPSAYDITSNPNTSIYFPAIGYQGEIESCAGWATTYYQYTYEVNKFRNVATTPSNTFSPSWTYNYINGGSNIAVYLNDAYFVLKNQGAMLLSDYPHSSSLSSYSFAWSSNLDKMRSALRYRSTVNTLSVPYTSLASLNTIKSKIASGKPAVIWTNPNGWSIMSNSSGQKAVVRDSYSNGGHFMTVVGYDDNFSITVNNQTMSGALKLANSWGANWSNGNNGYIWVMYDALLLNSAYGTNWQTGMNGERKPVFGFTSYNVYTNTYIHYNNQFTFMTIHECDNYFIETVKFTSYEPFLLSIYGKNGSASTSSTYQKKQAILGAPLLSTPTTRYLVFDYTNPDNSFNVLSNLSTSWSTTLYSTSLSSTYNIQAKLTDNLGNLIEPYYGENGTISNNMYTKTHYSNIAKGRVSAYDNANITEADATLILQYIARIVDFSSLQYVLADYNEDGIVDVSDVVLMYDDISSKNGHVFSLNDILPGTNYSIKDFIEDTLHIPYETYVNTHMTELDSIGVIY